MKVGMVFTATTPELVACVENELQRQLQGKAELLRYENPDILQAVRSAGYVTPAAAALLMQLFAQAMLDGADVLLNVCSSVGEVADSVQDFAAYTGIPVVRLDTEMCREAVRRAKHIGVMATLSTTLEPTCHTLHRAARELNRRVQLTPIVLDGAFGLNPQAFAARMVDAARCAPEEVELLLFAQGSMAYCEAAVQTAVGKPVLSSPAFGAAAVKQALQAKGLL